MHRVPLGIAIALVALSCEVKHKRTEGSSGETSTAKTESPDAVPEQPSSLATSTLAATPGPQTLPPTVPVAIAPLAQKLPESRVKLEVQSQYGLLAPDANAINVLIKMTGEGEAASQGPPLDLAIVIDRSGSMSGDKILAVKQAALQLLDRLGPEDTVTLVSYSTTVIRHATRRPVDHDGRVALRNALLQIQARGDTALGPAMFDALAALESFERTKQSLSHVLLLSDGLANTGEQNPDVLGARAATAFARGVSVSTLGVGLDYNEDLMTRIANQGGGRYHFIERGDAVAGVLDTELKGLAATVARNVVVAFHPAANVSLAKVYGYPYTPLPGGVVRISVGSVAAGITRSVVARLALVPTGAAGIDRALGRFEVHYLDVLNDGKAGNGSTDLALPISGDVAAVAASERPEITVRVAEVENSERLQLAAVATGSGRYQEAQQMLNLAIGDVREKQLQRTNKGLGPSPKLERQIHQLEDAQEGVLMAPSSPDARKRTAKKAKFDAYNSF